MATTATVPVTLRRIFSLPREEVEVILRSQGRSLTASSTENREKALNVDRAIVAMLYYNHGQLQDEKDREVVKNPRFYEAMSQSTSLDQGLRVLYPTALPPAVVDVVLSYLTPEEAYLRSLVEVNPTLKAIAVGADLWEALKLAIEQNSVKLVDKVFQDMPGLYQRDVHVQEELKLTTSLDVENIGVVLLRAMELIGKKGSGELAIWSIETMKKLYPDNITSSSPYEYSLVCLCKGAASKGNAHFIKWLLETYRVTFTPTTYYNQYEWREVAIEAINGGHLEVLLWLIAVFGDMFKDFSFMENVFDDIVVTDKVNMLEKLYPYISDRGIPGLVESAIAHNSYECLKWLDEHEGDTIITEYITTSLEENPKDELEYKVDLGSKEYKTYMYAIEHCDKHDCDLNEIIYRALVSGRLWLAENLFDNPDVDLREVEEALFERRDEERGEGNDDVVTRLETLIEIVREKRIANTEQV